jgi:hypothetical protein
MQRGYGRRGPFPDDLIRRVDSIMEIWARPFEYVPGTLLRLKVVDDARPIVRGELIPSAHRLVLPVRTGIGYARIIEGDCLYYHPSIVQEIPLLVARALVYQFVHPATPVRVRVPVVGYPE